MNDFQLFTSKNVVFENRIEKAGILVNNQGKIEAILDESELSNMDLSQIEVFDYKDLFIMSGVIDSHVHVNEPGRTDWEGYYTATRAAAKGGITTIADMPLNSIPPTTTVENLKKKLEAARNQIFVDVAFWGGLVPNNHDDLLKLIQAGVIGFKCFLCPSGVDEFPQVNSEQIELALKILEGTNSVLAFHAELELSTTKHIQYDGNPSEYVTFLNSRPSTMETEAIKLIISLCSKYNVRCHIVHLSSADALPLIREFKANNNNLTIETCHHYLTFAAEKIPNGSTQFKCCPPIRNDENKNRLWNGIKNKDIDLVVSDHSPCTPDLKLLSINQNKADFLKAWGGISSLQFGLSLFWTNAQANNLNLLDVTRILSINTSRLCNLQNRKGFLKEHYDADIVIWNPNEQFIVQESDIEHKNKITPYLNMTLYGKVYQTIVQGKIVFDLKNGISTTPSGNLIYNKK